MAIEEIANRGSIKESDVRRIEDLVYANGSVGRAEAEMLFALQDVARVKHASWADFFVKAIGDHIVDVAEPAGYVDVHNADWLMRWITCDGRIATRAELDLLASVLERARWSPLPLVTFALEQVRLAVVHGTGPLRAGCAYVPAGAITADDAAFARRVLCAFGRDASLPITRTEADTVLDIEACAEGERPAQWTDLLARVLAHGLLAGGGIAVVPRDRALQGTERFTQDATREDRALAKLERQRLEIVTNAQFLDCDATWLARRMGHFTDLSPRELELIGDMLNVCPEVERVLRDQGIEFIDDVAAA